MLFQRVYGLAVAIGLGDAPVDSQGSLRRFRRANADRAAPHEYV